MENASNEEARYKAEKEIEQLQLQARQIQDRLNHLKALAQASVENSIVGEMPRH